MAERNYRDNTLVELDRITTPTGEVDEAKFSLLCHTLHQHLILHAIKTGVDEQTAEDIIQEVFVMFYHRLLEQGDTMTFSQKKSFLLKCIHNAVINTHRSNKHDSLQMRNVVELDDQSNHEIISGADTESSLFIMDDKFFASLREYIVNLPSRSFHLDIVDILERYGEISKKLLVEHLHITREQAAARLHRFRVQLRKFMDIYTGNTKGKTYTYQYVGSNDIREESIVHEGEQKTLTSSDAIELCIQQGYVPLNYLISKGHLKQIGNSVWYRRSKIIKKGIQVISIRELRRVIPQLNNVNDLPSDWIKLEDLELAASAVASYENDVSRTLALVKGKI